MDLVLVCGQVAVAANFLSTIEYNVISVFFSSAGNIVFMANDYIGTFRRRGGDCIKKSAT